jgi:hypothetical protein
MTLWRGQLTYETGGGPDSGIKKIFKKITKHLFPVRNPDARIIFGVNNSSGRHHLFAGFKVTANCGNLKAGITQGVSIFINI